MKNDYKILKALKDFELLDDNIAEIISPYERESYFDYNKKVSNRVSLNGNNVIYSSLKNSYISEDELMVELSELLHIIRNFINLGNFLAAKNRVSDLTEILSVESLSEKIKLKIGRTGKEIVISTIEIFNRINFEDYFDSLVDEFPEIIKELSEELMFRISEKPELMQRIEGLTFENFVANILRKQGMEAEVTTKTRDGGIDVIAFKDDKYTKRKYIFQCKRNNSNNKVGIDVVQRMNGLRADSDGQFIVTTSTFTKSAIDWIKKNQQYCIGLELVDYQKLAKWLKSVY
jgi:hypothetical protein